MIYGLDKATSTTGSSCPAGAVWDVSGSKCVYTGFYCLDFTSPLNNYNGDTPADLSDYTDEVVLLQSFLRAKDYLSAKSTGYFGPLTFNALRSYQTDSGISNTGYLGPQTRAKIKLDTCVIMQPDVIQEN